MDPGAGAGAGDTAAGEASSGGVPVTQQPEDQQAAPPPPPPPPPSQPPSRYESQKRRDWNTFLQYLNNHKPPLTLPGCSGANVIEFLKYLDQFGKTKVHAAACAYFGQPAPPASCACPLMQAWGSLDALIGRLRAAYDESGGRPESNPFAHRAVRVYLREVRETQAKARGIPYEKKKRKRGNPPPPPPPAAVGASSSGAGGSEGGIRGGESSSTTAAASTASETATVSEAEAATASEAATSTGTVGGSSSPAAEGSGAPAAEGSSSV